MRILLKLLFVTVFINGINGQTVKGRIDHVVPDGSDTLGNIYLTVTGGTSPYTYTWTPGGSNVKDLTNAVRNSYTVNVKDNASGNVFYKYKLGYKTRWTNFVSCIFRNDSLIGKTVAPDYPGVQWNTCISKTTLKAGQDGWVQWVCGPDNYKVILGFLDSVSIAATGISNSDIDYGVYINGTTFGKISGGTVTNFTTAATGDVIRMERVGTNLTIYKNSVSIATYTVSTAKDWKLKTSLMASNTNANIGSSFTDTTSSDFPNYVEDIPIVKHCSPGTSNGSIKLSPRISGTAHNYTWSPSGATTSSISGLSTGNYSVDIADTDSNKSKYNYNIGFKTYWTNFYYTKSRNDSILPLSPASHTGWGTALSKNTLLSGTNGWVEFVSTYGSTFMVGFTDSASVVSGTYSDIDYGVYFIPGRIYAVLGGVITNLGNYGNCRTGESIRIERDGSVFSIKVNGITTYTTSCNTANWKIKTGVYLTNSFANIGASFTDTSAVNFQTYVEDTPIITHCIPGSSNGTIKLTPRISGTSHSYTWSPGGATTSSVTSLAPGNYTVLIKDGDNNVSKYSYNVGYKTFWTDFYRTEVRNDSLLKKSPVSPTGWNTMVSKNTLKSGVDGWVEFIVNGADDHIIGFIDSCSSVSGVVTDFDFGVNYANYAVYKSIGGTSTYLCGYKPKDIIRLERVGSVFNLKLNGATITTLTANASIPLKIKAALKTTSVANVGASFIDSTGITFPNFVENTPSIYHSSGLYVSDAKIALTPKQTGAYRTFTWSPNGTTGSPISSIESANYTVTVQDSLQNSSTYVYQVGYKARYTTHVSTYSRNDTLFTQTPYPGSTVCTALSKNVLKANKNGGVSWVVSSISSNSVIVGLLDSSYASSGNTNDIDFGIRQINATVYNHVTGVNLTHCDPGDILKIQRLGNTITFSKNGYAIYTTTTALVNKDWKIKVGVYGGANLPNLGCTFSTPLNATINKEHADYENPINGSANVFPHGGVSPYTFLWNDGDTLSYKTNLVPGTYTVVVSDSAQKNKIGKVVTIGVKPNWKIRKNIRITSDSTYMINTDSLGRLIAENYINKNEAGWQETTITRLDQDVAIGLIGLPSSYIDTTVTPAIYPDTAMTRKSNLAYALMRKATRDSLVYGGGSNLLQLSVDYDLIHFARIKNGQFTPLFRNTPITTVFSYGLGDILKIGRDSNGKVYIARNDTTLYTQSSGSSTQYLYPSMLAKAGPTPGKGGVSVGPYLGPISPFTTCANDKTKNWTSTREFDEYGNAVSETREYFDNLGRPTQTQTKCITDNNFIAAEAIYDSHGRAVGQTLPAPLYSTYQCFAPTFFSNTSGTHYGLDNFDKPITTSSLTGETNNPSSVGNSLQGTLGWYYSNNNTADGFVPADGYPYSRLEYTSDALSRFARSGSPGNNHKFGMNHYKTASYTDGSADLSCVFPNGTYELDENFSTKTYSVNAYPPLFVSPTTLSGVHKTTTCNEDGRCQANYTTESGKLIATCVNGTDWTVYYYDIKGRLKAMISPEDFVCGATPHRIEQQDTTTRAFSCDTTRVLATRNITNPVPGTSEIAHWVIMEVEPSVNYFDTLLTYSNSYDFRFKSNDTLVFKDTIPVVSYFDCDSIAEIIDTSFTPFGFHIDSLFTPFAEGLKNDVRGRIAGKVINYTGKYIFGVVYSTGDTTFLYDQARDFDYDIFLSDSGNTRIVSRLPDDKVRMFFADTVLGGATKVIVKCKNVNINLTGFEGVPFVPFSPCDTNMFVTQWEAELLTNLNANTSLVAKTIIGTGPPVIYYPPFSRKYFYNEYDHVTWSESLNEGRTDYLYDLKEDKLLFSQNDKQQANNDEFSYLKYDDLGRLIESGVFDPTIADGSASTKYVFQTYADWKASVSPGSGNTSVAALASTNTMFSDFGGTRSTEEKYIQYDLPDGSMPLTSSGYSQKYTGGNISRTYNANSSTWYSYDEMGRVKFVIQDIAGLGAKSLDYSYDMRGKLLLSQYQAASSDIFLHAYAYDSDERYIAGGYSRSPYSSLNFSMISKLKYYPHGALKRKELGNNLQGLDYTYTINGLLKAVNNPISTGADPGNDAPGNNGFSADLFSYALDYYSLDYERNWSLLNSNKPTSAYSNANVSYTGIANAIRWRNVYPSSAPAPSPSTLSGPFMYEYDIDSHYRIKGAKFGRFSIVPTNAAVTGDISFTASNSFKMQDITYDKNGNILTVKRNSDDASGVLMDDLTYNYSSSTTNKLNSVTDAVTTSLGLTADIDLPNQSNSSNYSYNAIGQVTLNIQDDQKYFYDASGLVTKITKNSNSNILAEFKYNDKNLRQLKISYNSSGTAILKTYYVYDEAGNLIATYSENLVASTPPAIQDFVMYGTGREGVFDVGTTKPYFELTDHLGNVREVFTDVSGAANAVSYTDFYPHGGVLPGRNFVSTPAYRYNYQGQEKDGETNLVNFELRQMDPRIGRWFIPDPYQQHHSPYLSMGNNPQNFTDPNGGFDDSGMGFTESGIENYRADIEYFKRSGYDRNAEKFMQQQNGYTYDDFYRERMFTSMATGGYTANDGSLYTLNGGIISQTTYTNDPHYVPAGKIGDLQGKKGYYISNVKSSTKVVGTLKKETLDKLFPRHENIEPYTGFWGTLDFYLTSGYQNGQAYDQNGQWLGAAPVMGIAPDVSFRGSFKNINTVYKGIKNGLPYIGKSFNLLTRYSKAARAVMQIAPVLSNIKNPMLLRAVEQRIIEYMRTLGPIANKRNAFNPLDKNYAKYMKMADKWLETNAPLWKDMFTK